MHLHDCLGNTPTSCPDWDGTLVLGSFSTAPRLLGNSVST